MSRCPASTGSSAGAEEISAAMLFSGFLPGVAVVFMATQVRFSVLRGQDVCAEVRLFVPGMYLQAATRLVGVLGG